MNAIAVCLLSLAMLWGSMPNFSQAQTTNITSSGLGTTLNGGVSCAGDCTITGGTRPGGGPNLFHSFGNFSVGDIHTANFFNDSGLATSNILSRVTGGNQSNIFGTIKTTDFGNANLFLINPAGVVFGPNASLDIGSSVGTPGSFHVSTADYLKMTDGSLFIANPNFENSVNSDGSANTTVLSSAAPQAFGFLSSSPASITFDNSFLAVGVGQTLSLSVVGGDITMTGGMLAAPSGQINLASVASPGEVLLPTMQYAPNVNGQSFTAFGNVTLSSVTLDVSDNLFEGDGHAGTVLIRGGQFVLDNSFILAQTFGDEPGGTTAVDIDMQESITVSGGSQIFSFNFALGRSGDIRLIAPDITVTDFSAIATASFGDGRAGDVTLSGNVLLFNNAQIVSDPFASGPGGTITITGDTVTLQENSFINTLADSTGAGGDIIFNVGTLTVEAGEIVAETTNQAPAGSISVSATGTVTLSGQNGLSRIETRSSGAGGTGDITLNVGSLRVLDGAIIEIGGVPGPGVTSYGSVTIVAASDVTIDGGNVRLVTFGTSVTSVGSLTIDAPSLSIISGEINTQNSSPVDGADILLTTGNMNVTGGSRVFTTTVGPGKAGDIVFSGDSLVVSGAGSGLFSDSQGAPGRGGDIQVSSTQVLMSEGGTISAKGTGTGDAGNIQITASDSLVMQNGSITTETIQSDGGNIHIQVGRLVQLTDSQITTSVQGGLGNGGNITIDPQFVILQGSQILANAFGGNGGNILIVAGVFIADPTSTISASSTFGVSGTIQIQSTVSNLSESVTPLSGEFVQTPELLQARCAARLAGGTASSFVVAGRDGLPFEPGGLLPSPLFVERQGSPRLARSLDVPGLRALVPLEMGCAS